MKEKNGARITREAIEEATKKYLEKGGKINKSYDDIPAEEQEKMNKVLSDLEDFNRHKS